jgi:hypothetical protein
MGSLAWLGYLSHTQVVESSNLSPSTYFVLNQLMLLESRLLEFSFILLETDRLFNITGMIVITSDLE